MGTNGEARLAAILLLTYTRSGASLVFHYPPEPRQQSNGVNSLATAPDVIGNGIAPAVATPHDGKAPAGAVLQHDAPMELSSSVNDIILGYPEETLEKLLSAGRGWDRKKFEICLNGLTFVGHPIHAGLDGAWAKPRTSAPADDVGRPTTPTGPRLGAGNSFLDGQQAQPGVTITEATPARPTYDFSHVPESLDSQGHLSLATSMNSASSTFTAGPVPLTAFHVVFVILPPWSGFQYVQDMYEHVAKKLGKALKYCQKQSSYVGNESRRLTSLKTKAKQDKTSRKILCDQMLESSELAWALKEVFEKINTGAIAAFRLSGMDMSLQLPDHSQQQDSSLSRHNTILLLEDKDKLLRELSHPDASPLALFIREHTPIKTLQKQATKLNMPINSVLYLARHLVKWRKARTITPLHSRNTYLIANEAPLSQLETHAKEYAHRFAGLPSLPQLLKVLSGRPIKYGLLIPSRDHQAPYMEILAYLARHKFVEQLKTSGWLQAPPIETKGARVDMELNKNRRPLSVANLLSPQLRPVADDDAASISSERTAIPISIEDRLSKDNVVAHEGNSRPATGAATASPPTRIVKDPKDGGREDLLCLRYIRENINDAELCNRLPSLYQYFDGEAALEDISSQEGLKRSVMEKWIDLLNERGFLLIYRHT